MFCVVGFGVGLVRRCVFLEFGFAISFLGCFLVSVCLVCLFGLWMLVVLGVLVGFGWFWLVLTLCYGCLFVCGLGFLQLGVVLLGECCLWCLISWYFDFAVGLV